MNIPYNVTTSYSYTQSGYAIVVAFLLLLAKGGLLYKQTKAG